MKFLKILEIIGILLLAAVVMFIDGLEEGDDADDDLNKILELPIDL